MKKRKNEDKTKLEELLKNKELIKQKEEELKQIAIQVKTEKKKLTKKDFLDSISNTIKFLLEKQNLSYPQLRIAIKKTYEIDVSEATLRAFAINVLGIRKKDKKETTNEQTNDFGNKFS
jgi:uncharacterized protein YihD (DUF1040 family)